MAAATDLWIFFGLVLGVIVLPGMDMAYVAGNALVGGWRAATAAVAGIVAGGLVHVAVAFTGLAALLSVWPAAFDALLVAGAAYMVWIGVAILRSAGAAQQGRAAPLAPVLPLPQVFARATLTCLLNPKAYAFMLAVFPAFMHAAGRPLLLQAAAMAAIIAATQVVVYGSVAAAAVLGRQASGTGVRWMPRVVGPMLVAGAAATLLLGWKPVQAQAPAVASGVREAAAGARDFDFLLGDWRIENRKRLVLLKGEDRWETFEAESHVRPLPGGVGNTDDYVAPAWRPGYVGVTLRVFNPATGRWSLYWLTNQGAGIGADGVLSAPVVGRFEHGKGVFEGDDTWDGRPIRVRYTWRQGDAGHAHWEQAFSPDGGRSWETNWTMEMTRLR